MRIRKRATKVNRKDLTPFEQLFVKEYLIDFNACAALRRTGRKYKTNAVERLTASRLIAKDIIQASIHKEFAARAAKVDVNVEFVLRELMQIANCDVLDAFDERGALKKIGDIPVHVRKSISSFSSEETMVKGFKEGTLKKVTFWDKKGSLELLGKYLAMFVDRQRMEDPNGEPLPAVQVHIHKHGAQPAETGIRPEVAATAQADAAAP